MGCDIHMYVEYKRKDNEKDYWMNFGERINPGRNYFMFGILSNGVRSNPEFSFDPKGMPEYDSLGYSSRSDALIYITDEEDDNENHTTLKQALKWQEYGHKIINGRDGKPTWIEHPDWHSHSWLTTEEFEKAMDYYRSQSTYQQPEYEAVLSAMKKFEELGFDSRIVFWFDN